jgi:hypothetical protein
MTSIVDYYIQSMIVGDDLRDCRVHRHLRSDVEVNSPQIDRIHRSAPPSHPVTHNNRISQHRGPTESESLPKPDDQTIDLAA